MLLDVPPQPEYLLQRGLIQPGTDIGRAIRFATRVFQRREVQKDKYTEASAKIFQKENKYKMLILVTDGENLVQSSVPFEAAKEAANKGIHIYTLGIGVPGPGAPIPLHDQEGKITGYKKDATGQTVLTQLNDTLLRKIASLGDGRYYLTSNKSVELDKLYKDISSLERRELEKQQFTQYKERFQYFLFLALVLLAGELILGDRKSENCLRFKT
jgi:Ca-activated chloride channel family protein